MAPIITVMPIIIPNQMGSNPSLVTTGKKMGVANIINARSSMKEPPMRYMSIMRIMTRFLWSDRPAIHSAAIMGISVIARKWPNTLDPARRARTIQPVRRDSSVDVMSFLKGRCSFATATNRTERVPTSPCLGWCKKSLHKPTHDYKEYHGHPQQFRYRT